MANRTPSAWQLSIIRETCVKSSSAAVSRISSSSNCGGTEGWPDDRVPVDVTFTDVTLRDSTMWDNPDLNGHTIRLYYGNPITFTRLKTTAKPPTRPTIVLGARGDISSTFDPTNAPCIVHMNEHQLFPGTRVVAYANRDTRQTVRFFVDGVEVADFLTNGWTAP